MPLSNVPKPPARNIRRGSRLLIQAVAPLVSGPAYATAFGTPVGGTGTWVNSANAEGAPDGSYAIWAVT